MASRVGINFKHREELDSAVRAMGGDPNDRSGQISCATFVHWWLHGTHASAHAEKKAAARASMTAADSAAQARKDNELLRGKGGQASLDGLVGCAQQRNAHSASSTRSEPGIAHDHEDMLRMLASIRSGGVVVRGSHVAPYSVYAALLSRCVEVSAPRLRVVSKLDEEQAFEFNEITRAAERCGFCLGFAPGMIGKRVWNSNRFFCCRFKLG